MGIRRAFEGVECRRFGAGGGDEPVTPSVTGDVKLSGRVARLEGEVAALRSQVSMLISAMAEPVISPPAKVITPEPVISGVISPVITSAAEKRKAKVRANVAAHRERKRKGG